MNAMEQGNQEFKYSGFYCEYNPYARFGKFPCLISREYRDEIGGTVILCDPNNNKVEVEIKRKKGRLYFRGGWTGLLKMYGLHDSGWIRISFVDLMEFGLDVQKRTLHEVCYPMSGSKFNLGSMQSPICIIDDDDDENEGDSSNGNTTGKNSNQWDETEKNRWYLTKYDPFYDYGRMPKLFCREHYYLIPHCVMLFDTLGNGIEVKISNRKGKVYLKNGWEKISTLYGIEQGGWFKMCYLSQPYLLLKYNLYELLNYIIYILI